MPSDYDELCDLRNALRTARFNNDEAGICVIETRIDSALDAMNRKRATQPRTGHT
jgi:hypothetical protein